MVSRYVNVTKVSIVAMKKVQMQVSLKMIENEVFIVIELGLYRLEHS